MGKSAESLRPRWPNEIYSPLFRLPSFFCSRPAVAKEFPPRAVASEIGAARMRHGGVLRSARLRLALVAYYSSLAAWNSFLAAGAGRFGTGHRSWGIYRGSRAYPSGISIPGPPVPVAGPAATGGTTDRFRRVELTTGAGGAVHKGRRGSRQKATRALLIFLYRGGVTRPGGMSIGVFGTVAGA